MMTWLTVLTCNVILTYTVLVVAFIDSGLQKFNGLLFRLHQFNKKPGVNRVGKGEIKPQ